MIHESEVRKQLAAVASRRVSMVAFERWLARNTSNMHIDSSPKAVDLVSLIHALLSERDDGAHSEFNLRREFLSLLNNVTESIEIGDKAIVPAISRFSATTYWVTSLQPMLLPA